MCVFSMREFLICGFVLICTWYRFRVLRVTGSNCTLSVGRESFHIFMEFVSLTLFIFRVRHTVLVAVAYNLYRFAWCLLVSCVQRNGVWLSRCICMRCFLYMSVHMCTLSIIEHSFVRTRSRHFFGCFSRVCIYIYISTYP